MDQYKLGLRIKQLRKIRGFQSQEALAQALREQYALKCDRPMVGKWEIGYQVPEVATLRCLADLFRVSLDYLTGQEPPDSDTLSGLTTQERRMIEAFRMLNPLGQDKAQGYLADLSALPRYCSDAQENTAPVTFYAVARGNGDAPRTLSGQAFPLSELKELDDDDF